MYSIEAFNKFHKNNPHVYKVFQEFAKELIERGTKVGSANSILHRIRWEVEIRTLTDDYLINQNYAADYARLAMMDGTVPQGFFRTKITKLRRIA